MRNVIGVLVAGAVGIGVMALTLWLGRNGQGLLAGVLLLALLVVAFAYLLRTDPRKRRVDGYRPDLSEYDEDDGSPHPTAPPADSR